MEFAASTTLDRSPGATFACLSDFEALAQVARSKGLTVTRMPAEADAQCWHVAGEIKGQKIDATVTLVEYMPHERIGFATVMPGLGAETTLSISPQDNGSSVVADVVLYPKSIKMRLLTQGMKLQKGRITRGFAKAIRKYVRQNTSEGA